MMNKLIITVALAVMLVGSAFAQDLRFGAPKAADTGLSGQSFTGSLDASLLKVAFFFDGLDNSYGAIMYDVAQLDGVANRPIRFAMTGAMSGTDTAWFGLGLNYDVVHTSGMTFGLALGSPGMNVDSEVMTMSKAPFKAIPGAYFSISLN
jgi:hypothetical protein